MTDAQAVRLAGGIDIPLVGLGTWSLTGQRGYLAISKALEIGYRHIDTATAYGNENQVGRAVADSGLSREQVFLTTKLPPEHAGREQETLAASLAALRSTYVDLWLVHWPPGREAAPETWEQFIAARDAGLARAIGVSNYSIRQIDELIAATGVAPMVNQIPYSPWHHDPQLLEEHRARGVVVEGYSPIKLSRLGSPVLTGIAANHGVTPTQVVLRWHLQHGVLVIPKSSHEDRMRSNLDVFGFSLTGEEMSRIDAIS